MKKRIIAVLILFSLVIGFAWAGAAAEEGSADVPTAPDDIWEKYDPTVTVTSVFALSAFLEDSLAKWPDVLEDNVWTRGYMDELGIKTEFLWTVPGSQYDEKLSIAIAANDLPDVIPTGNPIHFKQLVDSGVAMDITTLFDNYASPLTQQMQDLDSRVSLTQATVDGKLFALPLIYGNVDNCQLLWIRADWLEALNMEAPKTIDGLVELAEAFVREDPDGNGKDDTMGLGVVKELFGGFAVLNGFFEGFHAYPTGWLKNSSGNIVYGDIQPETKAALIKLAEMYEAGLIDQEFVVKDGGKVGENTTNGNIGMVYGQHWIPFWPLQDSKNANTDADWRAYPIPSADSTPAKTMLGGSINKYYVLNSEMENPEAAVKLLNYFIKKYSSLYSPDYELKYIGTTETLNTRADESWEYGFIQSWQPNENIAFWDLTKKYFDTKDPQYIENNLIKQFTADITKYLAGEDDSLWSTHAWIGPEGPYSVINTYFNNNQTILNAYIKANTPSMTERGAALDQLRVETFTKIITGAEPPDAFDDYVASWKRLGGDDITEEVNAVK